MRTSLTLTLTALLVPASFAAGILTLSTTTPAPFYFTQFLAEGTTNIATTGTGFFNKGTGTNIPTDALAQSWFFVKGDQDSFAVPMKWQDSYTASGPNATLIYSVGTNGNSVIGFKLSLNYSLVSYSTNSAVVKVDFTVKNVVTGNRTVDVYPYAEMNALDAGGNGGGASTCTYDSTTKSFRFTSPGSAFDSYFIAGTTPSSYQASDWNTLRTQGFNNALTGFLSNAVTPAADMSSGFHYRMTLAPNETSAVKTIYYGWNTLPQTGRTVSGVVTRNGGRALSSITVQFRNAGTQTTVGSPIVVPVDGGGNYSVAAPGAGNYDLTVMPTPYLRRTINTNTTASNVTNANLSLVPANIVMDNVIDIGDYTKLALYFGASSGDGNWNTPDGNGVRPSDADINGDNIVDIADYVLLSGNFSAVGDD